MKKSVGIITLHRTTNYGSVLQAYALQEKIKSLGKNSKYISDFKECTEYVKNNIQQNDIVITLGAGTVTQIATMLVEKNKL